MSGDDALKAARAAQKKARAAAQETIAPKRAKQSAAGKIASATRLLALWNKIEALFDMVWNGWLKPVTRFLADHEAHCRLSSLELCEFRL